MPKLKLYARFAWLFTLSLFLPTRIFTERLERLQAELQALDKANGHLVR